MSDGLPNELPENEQATVSAELTNTTSLGERLAAERNVREWTIEYVASQLNLAARQIQALENENYAALPGMASVRGFVRAYAKLLKVDPAPLIALIASEQITPNLPLEPKRNISSAPFSDARLNGGGNRRNSAKAVLVAVVVVLLALLMIGLEHLGGWPTLSQSLSNQFKEMSAPGSASNSGAKDQLTDSTTDKPADANEEQSRQSALPNPLPASAPTSEDHATPTAASVPEAHAVTLTPAPTPALVSQPAPPVVKSTPVVANAPAKPDVKMAPAESKPAVPSGSGQGALVLTAKQNSWAEVRVGNNLLLARLLKAGETEHLDLPAGATLTLGNGPGVAVVFRGQTIETKGDGKSNVARISLK